MKVTLATYGGQTATMSLLPKTVDSVHLSQVEADELSRLVMAAKQAEPAELGVPGRGGDVGTRVVTIEAGGEPVVLSQSDTKSSPAFDGLCNWIERHSKSR